VQDRRAKTGKRLHPPDQEARLIGLECVARRKLAARATRRRVGTDTASPRRRYQRQLPPRPRAALFLCSPAFFPRTRSLLEHAVTHQEGSLRVCSPTTVIRLVMASANQGVLPFEAGGEVFPSVGRHADFTSHATPHCQSPHSFPSQMRAHLERLRKVCFLDDCPGWTSNWAAAHNLALARSTVTRHLAPSRHFDMGNCEPTCPPTMPLSRGWPPPLATHDALFQMEHRGQVSRIY
jgi:hypothetical protein